MAEEETGAIVDEDEYFQLLDKSQVLMLLRKDEEWPPQMQMVSAITFLFMLLTKYSGVVKPNLLIFCL